MSELSQEDGRLFTVLMIVAGLGSTVLFAVALFFWPNPGGTISSVGMPVRSWKISILSSGRVCPFRFRLRKRKTIVTKPTINLNGTSPGELLEQHLPAINGLRSAISTLRAAAPNARDYQTERLDAFALAMNEHRDRLARRESVMDELEQLAESISDQC